MVSRFVSLFWSNVDPQLLIFDRGRIRLFQPSVAGSRVVSRHLPCHYVCYLRPLECYMPPTNEP